MLILAQAKLLDACIKIIDVQELSLRLMRYLLAINYFYVASVLRSLTLPAFWGLITNNLLLVFSVY